MARMKIQTSSASMHQETQISIVVMKPSPLKMKRKGRGSRIEVPLCIKKNSKPLRRESRKQG
jgi:hypothetical protein